MGTTEETPGMPRWWWSLVIILAIAAGLFAYVTSGRGSKYAAATVDWWVVTTVLHAPLLVILAFVAFGLVERVGFYWCGRSSRHPGPLPEQLPTVCVQLPMFNERTVAQRVVEAAAALDWPADRLVIQVLDDSTDDEARRLVDATARAVALTGVRCEVVRRAHRTGYKAGALEAGRHQTHAEFLAIFDADFIPPPDYLRRTIPHFFRPDGRPDVGLALVQAQWGHLNNDESWLTRAQSLWVDDHHTLQMSWRSAAWSFVNFTGTAGVWRASAIQEAGGWGASSLVEDCELSFRHLFAGYRTAFVKEVVVPAELPATFTAYKAQQRRWTRGWVQLQRLHLATLVRRHPCRPLRRIHLLQHMCSSWQWPAWAIWSLLLPFLILTGHWLGAVAPVLGVVLYLLPAAVWAAVSASLATAETRHTYADPLTPGSVARRVGRVVPHALLNAGMLPHQLASFAEGLFGPLGGEFERTPKAATMAVGRGRRPERVRKLADVRVHWPYVLFEAGFVVVQIGWAVAFAASGLMLCAIGAGALAACVLVLAFHYGDNMDKVCFVISRRARVPV